MGLTLVLAQPLYCKRIRVIGEYYFWYDQILASLPGNQNRISGLRGSTENAVGVDRLRDEMNDMKIGGDMK
jgi:hypothetical protein